MSVITRVPESNLWLDICKGFEAQKPPFKDEDAMSVHTQLDDFDPAKHNPVFYGKMHQKINVDDVNTTQDYDPSICHPALIGHALLDRPAKSPPPPPLPKPDLKTCSPKLYLEAYIFPVLLPALEEMLKQAKIEKCFERKRTKFNGLDFLTESLYNKNPEKDDRDNIPLGEIPFVKEHWEHHPRPPLPMSLLWSEEEASLIVQAFYRGYKVRTDPAIQELRQWQKEWREENANIKNKVDDFWAKQMPDSPIGSDGLVKQIPEGQSPTSFPGSSESSDGGFNIDDALDDDIDDDDDDDDDGDDDDKDDEDDIPIMQHGDDGDDEDLEPPSIGDITDGVDIAELNVKTPEAKEEDAQRDTQEET